MSEIAQQHGLLLDAKTVNELLDAGVLEFHNKGALTFHPCIQSMMPYALEMPLERSAEFVKFSRHKE